MRLDTWEASFYAVSVTLGVTRDEAVAALGEAGVARAGSIVRALAAHNRVARANALASALAEILRDVVATGAR